MNKKYIVGILLLTVVSSLIGFSAADSQISDGSQVTIHVNGNTGVDSNDGSFENPVKSLKQAIDIAPEYATIKIANGVYTGPDNTDLLIQLKTLNFVGESKEGAVLDANGAGHIITVHQGLENRPDYFLYHSNTSFENLTFENASLVALLLRQSGTNSYQDQLENEGKFTEIYKDIRYIRNCNFLNNGEAACTGTEGYTISGCVFSNNTAQGINGRSGAAGAAIDIHGDTDMENCIFTNNHVINGPGGAIFAGAGVIRLSSNFFDGNTATDSHGNSLGNSVSTFNGYVFLGDKNAWGRLRESYSDKLKDELGTCDSAGNFTLFTE